RSRSWQRMCCCCNRQSIMRGSIACSPCSRCAIPPTTRPRENSSSRRRRVCAYSARWRASRAHRKESRRNRRRPHGMGLVRHPRDTHQLYGTTQNEYMAPHKTSDKQMRPMEGPALMPAMHGLPVKAEQPGLVLIAEDDEGIALALEILIEDAGYRAVHAAHGEQAL